MSTTEPLLGIVHGRHSSYTYHGCRCDPCRQTHLDYMRTYDTRKDQRRSRWLTPGQTQQARRKLQLLQVLGWSNRQVADASGINTATLVNFRTGRTRRATQRTGDGIDQAHRRLTSNNPPARRRRVAGTNWPTIRTTVEEPDDPAPRTVTTTDATTLIRQLQRHLDLSQTQLAATAGLSSKTITRIVNHQQSHVSDDAMTALEELAHAEGVPTP